MTDAVAAKQPLLLLLLVWSPSSTFLVFYQPKLLARPPFLLKGLGLFSLGLSGRSRAPTDSRAGIIRARSKLITLLDIKIF